ncbi:hypothetical protein ACJX0J_017882, partial [Zea mays]
LLTELNEMNLTKRQIIGGVVVNNDTFLRFSYFVSLHGLLLHINYMPAIYIEMFWIVYKHIVILLKQFLQTRA